MSDAQIASPALLGGITRRYTVDVKTFAEEHRIPLIHFGKGQRKDDAAAQYRRKSGTADRVVFIGRAQEKVNSFKATKHTKGKLVWFPFSRQSTFTNVYYFYIQDAEFGPGFI